MSKQLIVELTGPARIIAGRKEVTITVAEEATWRDVLAALARALPALVGEVISADNHDIVGPYLLNVGGRYAVRNFDEKAPLQDGDHLSLLEETC